MAEQLFQIAAKALIRNKNGEILMVHLPKWGYNPEHWDLPGGRMDPGEGFLQTLKRELIEEIGAPYVGEPKQIAGMLTNITIPVGDERIPLVFMIYEAQIADTEAIRLDPAAREDEYRWFTPTEAADVMVVKFSAEFCDVVRAL